MEPLFPTVDPRIRFAQPPEPTTGDGDNWRKVLADDCRHRIVNNIVDTLKRNQFYGSDELWKQAAQFEHRIFHSALNQDDYLQKISFWEKEYQNSVANAIPTASPGNSTDPGSGLQAIPKEDEEDEEDRELNKKLEELEKKMEGLKKEEEKLMKEEEELSKKREKRKSQKLISVQQIPMKRRGLLSKQCPTQLQLRLQRMSLNN